MRVWSTAAGAGPATAGAVLRPGIKWPAGGLHNDSQMYMEGMTTVHLTLAAHAQAELRVGTATAGCRSLSR